MCKQSHRLVAQDLETAHYILVVIPANAGIQQEFSPQSDASSTFSNTKNQQTHYTLRLNPYLP